MRVVHYINQFFAGVGGEDQATVGPAVREGAVGPGRKLAASLAALGDLQLVATVYCGDDYAASEPHAAAEILALAQEAGAEAVIAGPAFGSGRYGIACGRVATAAAAAGLPAVAGMDPANPGLPEVSGPAVAVNSGDAARHMGDALGRMAAALSVLAAGGTPGEEEGVIQGGGGGAARRNSLAERNAAQRGVLLALRRLAGGKESEIGLPDFGGVTPASPVADPAEALVAILTEGALVPMGNPDRLESARAKHWFRYSLEDRTSLPQGEWQSVHGGFSTVIANADPHRMLPLDTARELESEGRIGQLYGSYLTTAGNGTAVADATHFGVEWAAELRRAGVQAAILTST